MVATNMQQLQKMLMDALQKGMNQASQSILEVMQTETDRFYTQGKPKLYERTGKLGDSPKVTPVAISGKEASFDAYIDQSYSYAMPNWDFIDRGYASYFSTPDVIEAAENHTSGILGKPGFWARSEAKMQQELDNAMRSVFPGG